MNELKTNSNGGFPLNLNDIRFLDNSYREVFSGLLSPLDTVANNCIILSGIIKDSQGIYSEGYVVLDGEVCFFPEQEEPVQANGGDVLSISIVSTYDMDGLKVFQDGSSVDTYGIRRAELSYVAPAGSVILLANAKSYYDVLNNKLDVVPSGVIVMWSGSINNIPTGYFLCDGTNNTPNLSGKFIVGYNASDTDYNPIGKKGGEKDHQLTASEMPSHNHGLVLNGNADPVHSIIKTVYNDANNPGFGINLGSRGSDAPHENRPPYYTLAYIIKGVPVGNGEGVIVVPF